MATTLSECRDLIKTKLEALGGEDTPIFGEVFDYAQGDFTRFPAAVILPTGGSEGEVIDTHRNHRTFSFLTTCYFEQTNSTKTKEEVNDIMTSLVDQVIVAFDQDKNFNYAVEQVKVVKMDFDFKVANGTFDFASFQIDCVVVIPNYVPGT